ncbi:DMT family transporter [Rhodospirillaceae bacterium KN72]|uniref:DMT family transporter n=1 Tax=Pacificispira spongiicola TaxID=2729598 RepID=A0A7Y0HFD0_9PROT|nr:DMT family transporter [Pacificispira spongiicola]NMM43837.1 DMT family transporter [Pacificispira spongiicola]
MSVAPSQNRSDRRQAVLLLLGTGGLLGTSAIVAKAAAGAGMSPLILLLWSMLGGGVIQWARLALRGQRLTVSRTILLYAVGSGLFFAIPNALAFAAVPHLGAGFVAMCFAFPLMVTYAIALVFRMERFQVMKFAAVVSGLTGGLLLAASKVQLDSVDMHWVLMALSAPVLIAFGNIYRTLYWPKNGKAEELSIGMLLAGTVVLAIVLTLPGIETGAQVWSGEIWSGETLALTAAQSIAFAVLYDLYFRLQKLAGPVYLSQIGSVSAVTGVLLALIFFGEVPGFLQIAAAVFIAIGLILMNRAQQAPLPAREDRLALVE